MRRSNDSELLHCVGPLLALRRHSSIADGLPLSGEGGRVANITPMAEVDPELTLASRAQRIDSEQFRFAPRTSPGGLSLSWITFGLGCRQGQRDGAALSHCSAVRR